MVPADSRRIPRAPRYSGAAWQSGLHFAYGTVTLFRQAFLPVPLWIISRAADGPTTPGAATRQPRFGLLRVRSPLLAQSLLLSFPPGTKMFQFPTFAPNLSSVSGSLPTGFPIRTSAGQRAFAPHRGFSQLVTSFIASESHRHPPCALVRFLLSLSPCRCNNRAPRGAAPRGIDLLAY